MPPKKGQKMSLNEFLGDSALGSWADEMDSLPSAPAPKTDDDYNRPRDRDFSRSDRDFSRTERSFPPRDEVPLPTQPPYTAFVGNLAFDLTEGELESFFGDHKTKSVKIIKDRDEKPKGFGYVEFVELAGLKAALLKSGAQMSNRTVRVSVAEPPKERDRPYGDKGGFDDDKFAGSWRRDGPLPERSPSRSDRRSRFDDGPDRGSRPERVPSTLAEENGDWRSNRPQRAPEPDLPRRRSGFSTPDGPPNPADSEGVWQIGSKFKPSAPSSDAGGKKFGSLRSDRGLKDEDDPSDWRSGSRRTLSTAGRQGSFEKSPSSSTPPTPQLSRRKLELTPRSTAPSTHTSPLSSPKFASQQPVVPTTRSNPFGSAKPVDVAAREREVTERLERDARDREDSLAARRGGPPSRHQSRENTPPPAATSSSSNRTPTANVRPTMSFANAAGSVKPIQQIVEEGDPPTMETIVEKTTEISV